MEKEKKSDPAKGIGKLLMTLGALLVIAAVALALYNYINDEQAGSNSNSVLENIKEACTGEDIHENPPVKIIDGYGYIGYLTFPTLELELPVMSEWDYERLKTAPCLYYGTALTKDMVIAGHNYRKHFGKISLLRRGDTVYFKDVNDVLFEYEVCDIEILKSTSIEEMNHSGWELSLYTCTYDGRSRITVRCKLVTEK